MRSSIPSNLREKYSELFEAEMLEVKERYLEQMRATSLLCVLKVKDDEDWSGIPDPPYKLPGRSENYSKFLKNRQIIAKKYFLSHKLMRAIVTRAALRLPMLICDFSKYRQLGYMDFLQ